MAFGTPVSLGSGQLRSSGTTVVMQAVAAAAVGDLVIVRSAWNNTDATDGPTDRLSCSDESGNTWTKIGEYTYSGGGEASGATVAAWLSVIETQIDITDDITITCDTAQVAKAVAADKFSIDEATVEVATNGYAENGNASGGLVDLSLSSLPTGEKLIIHAMARESSNADAYTPDEDYTALTTDGTEGGGTATNMNIRGAYRITTVTSDTNHPTGIIRDHAQLLFALVEVAGGGGTPVEIAAAGASLSSGVADLRVETILAALGESLSSGVGDLRVEKQIAASGESLSSGAAEVTFARLFAAVGESVSSGAAALRVQKRLAALGLSRSSGSSNIDVPIRLAAAGLSVSLGIAAIIVAKRIAASGSSRSSGRANLDTGGGAVAAVIRWVRVNLGLGPGL